MTAPVFTVSRVSSKQQQPSYRTDLDMPAQRSAAHQSDRDRLQAALMADYQQTVASRDTHRRFLTMMLATALEYQYQEYGVRVPARAAELIAIHHSREMSKNDFDHYAACLTFLASTRIYSRSFSGVANQMVREDEKRRTSTTSTESGSSPGMSDDGI